MKCQICGSDKCYKEITTIDIKYNGFGISVPECTIENCDFCGERVLDTDSSILRESVAKGFKKLIDELGVTCQKK